MRVLLALLHSFLGNRTGRRIEPFIKVLEEIEALIRMQSGIIDARVSVKTNAEHKRFIKIVIRCNSRYKHLEQFQKLQKRIITVVAPRIDGFGDQIQIQVERMKNPTPLALLPDSILH